VTHRINFNFLLHFPYLFLHKVLLHHDIYCSLHSAGAKREVEDRIIPRNVDADDSDVDVKSDDDRLVQILDRIKIEFSSVDD